MFGWLRPAKTDEHPVRSLKRTGHCFHCGFRGLLLFVGHLGIQRPGRACEGQDRYAYIDSVRITDVIIGKSADKINLVLNYNLTYGGQTADCTPSKSVMFAKNINHVLLEDGGYSCKMTTIGQSSVKTVFAIDYVDLDYGYVGGHYSIGISGPAHGGDTGYMILRMPKNAYPLAPELTAPAQRSGSNSALPTGSPASASSAVNNGRVQIFPLNKTSSAE